MNDNEEYSRVIKLIIIGDSGVGKTNILTRFANNSFSLESKTTIGVEFKFKDIEINGKKIKV